jgi:hypothetical protein
MGQSNVFYDLNLYGKELVVSNFLAWLFDSKGTHQFGDYFIKGFCNLIDPNIVFTEAIIKREFYGKLKNKKNYIDLVIELRNSKGIVAVIGVENKVFSREGVQQTQRYWNILVNNYDQKLYPIYAIYLTNENMPVSLTSTNFKHLKYKSLEKIMKMKKGKLDIIDDFIEAYIDRALEVKQYKFLNSDSFGELVKIQSWVEINDLTCKAICYNFNDLYPNLIAHYDYSARSGKTFYTITSNSWDKVYNKVHFNLHLEGDINKVVVHFEITPYVPINKIDIAGQNTFVKYRDYYRKLFENNFVVGSLFDVENINSRDKLTVLKLNIKSTYMVDLELSLKQLFDDVDKIV